MKEKDKIKEEIEKGKYNYDLGLKINYDYLIKQKCSICKKPIEPTIVMSGNVPMILYHNTTYKAKTYIVCRKCHKLMSKIQDIIYTIVLWIRRVKL